MKSLCGMASVAWLALGLTLPLAADDKGTLVGFDGLSSRTPADWKEEKPGSRMQFKVFSLPKAEGDSEDAVLTIFFFGPGGGGGVKDNLARWKGMFAPPEGKTIDEASKVKEFKAGQVPVTLLDVSGTYKSRLQPFNPDSPVKEFAGYRMLAVVFESENGPYFMRLVGPAKTVAKHQESFETWLKNFK